MNKPTCDYCCKRPAFFDTYLFGLPICLQCLRTFRKIEKDKRKLKLFYMVMEETTERPANYYRLKSEQRATFLKKSQTPLETSDVLAEIGVHLADLTHKHDRIEEQVAVQRRKTKKEERVKESSGAMTVVATKSSKKAFTYKKITTGAVYRNGKGKRQVISIGNRVGVAKQNPTHAKEAIYWIDPTTKAGGECRAKSFSDWFKR